MRIWTSKSFFMVDAKPRELIVLYKYRCLHRVSYIPDALSSGDERPLKKKDILKNTGNLLRIRQHIYLQEENLIDPPEMFWSNASLESKLLFGIGRNAWYARGALTNASISYSLVQGNGPRPRHRSSNAQSENKGRLQS